MGILQDLTNGYTPPLREETKKDEKYEMLLESIEDLYEKFSLFGIGSKEKTVKDPTKQLTMSRIHTVMLSPSDKSFGLKDKVFGIRNEDPIVAFMLSILGVPMDGSPIRIRTGFMQYDSRSKMLFIARFKADLPGERSGTTETPPPAQDKGRRMTILKQLLALNEAEKKDLEDEEADKIKKKSDEDKKPSKEKDDRPVAKKVDVPTQGTSKPLTSWAPAKSPAANVKPAAAPPGASDKSTDDWDPKVHSEKSGAWYIESDAGVGRTPYFTTKRASQDVRPGHKIVFGKWNDPDGHQEQEDFEHMKPTAMHEGTAQDILRRASSLKPKKAAKVFQGSTKLKEDSDEDEDDMDLSELIQKWMDKNKFYHFEGSRGEENFEKLIRVLGYRSMSDFLQDNSGCIEAMVEWVQGFNNSEWKEALKDALGPRQNEHDE